MAAPALDERITGKNIPVHAAEVVFVDPTLGSAVDVIAVVKHPTRPVRVSIKLKIRDLHGAPRLARVQVVNDFVALIKPDEVDAVFIANRNDISDQVLLFLA